MNPSSNNRLKIFSLPGLVILLALVSARTLPVSAAVTIHPFSSNIPATLASAYPQISVTKINSFWTELNQSAVKQHSQFLSPNLDVSIPIAFAEIRAVSSFNSSVSVYPSNSFWWGLNFDLNNSASVTLSVSLSAAFDEQYRITQWQVSLENYSLSGPTVIEYPVQSATASPAWAGFTYAMSSSIPEIDGADSNMYVATMSDPPSGQINSNYYLDGAEWVGLTGIPTGGTGILQAGYLWSDSSSYDACSGSGGSYMLWWEYAGGNSLTEFSSTSCANAGDELYVETDYNNWYTEVCDDSKSGSPCWSSTYSPSSPFTPYYAQFEGEAVTAGGAIQQIPEFSYDSSYGMLFFNSAIYDDFYTYYPPGSGYLDASWYLAQSSYEPEAYYHTDDWSSDNLDVTWDNSYYSASYMCSNYDQDCG